MSAVATPASTLPEPAAPPAGGVHVDLGVEHFYIHNASWQLLERFLDDNPRRRMRLAYAQGRMFVMSPLPIHEKWKGLLGRLVEAATEEAGLTIATLGSTTWLRPDLERGIESDECYYIASEPAVRGKMQFDLTRDPPPDLAIEVDVTHSPVDRSKIYAAIGVPELWIYDGKLLRFLKLASGAYEPATHSVNLPFISPADVQRHLSMAAGMDENSIVRSWREWVRQQKPRA